MNAWLSLLFSAAGGILVAFVPAAGDDFGILGTTIWEGQKFLSSFHAECLVEDNGRMQGVLNIRGPLGHEDTYHFSGQWNATDATFRATHHSGHRAQGRLLSRDMVDVDIETRDGTKISVRADRLPGTVMDTQRTSSSPSQQTNFQPSTATV